MSEKVYCLECNYYNSKINECRYEIRRESTYRNPVAVTPIAKFQNQENDCQFFKPLPETTHVINFLEYREDRGPVYTLEDKRRDCVRSVINAIEHLEDDILPSYRSYKDYQEKYEQCRCTIAQIKSAMEHYKELKKEERKIKWA